MVDVAVVGGGPAGSSAALTLARLGLEALVIDRSQFPRPKACGEYLGAGAVLQLAELGVKNALAPAAARLNGIRLSGNGVSVELRFSQAGWALPRAYLDDMLLQSAIGAGARFLQGRVENLKPEEAGTWLTVREPDGETRTVGARFVIAADGAHSLVAKKLGLTRPQRGVQRFALGGHYAGFADLEPYVEMFVEGSSYFAVNPFDAARANVMVIVRENDLAARRKDIDSFIRERAHELSGNASRFAQARLEGKRIAVGPLAYSTRGVAAGRVLLAGDAAGFIDPFTGQGVYLALRAGIAAAQTIGAAYKTPSQERSALRGYEIELRDEMQRRNRLARIVRSFVRSAALSKRVARNLERNPARGQILIDAIAGCGPLEPALRLGNLLRLVA